MNNISEMLLNIIFRKYVSASQGLNPIQDGGDGGGGGGGGAKNICWKRWGKAGGLSRNGEIAVLYGGFSGDSS